LAEFDRQQRVTDLFESAQGSSLRLTAEQVRKTGRDLAANASLPGGSLTLTIPSTTPLALYYLLACADDLSAVVESNEGNNCLAAATTVLVTRPDLVVTAVSNPPASRIVGQSFALTETVKNQGSVSASASTARYYLSANTLKNSGDILLSRTRSVPSLLPGASSDSGTITVTIPSTTPVGPYYLLVCADDTSVVAEANESNNCAASATTMAVSR